jgi:hypothetical protein
MKCLAALAAVSRECVTGKPTNTGTDKRAGRAAIIDGPPDQAACDRAGNSAGRLVETQAIAVAGVRATHSRSLVVPRARMDRRRHRERDKRRSHQYGHACTVHVVCPFIVSFPNPLKQRPDCGAGFMNVL